MIVVIVVFIAMDDNKLQYAVLLVTSVVGFSDSNIGPLDVVHLPDYCNLSVCRARKEQYRMHSRVRLCACAQRLVV